MKYPNWQVIPEYWQERERILETVRLNVASRLNCRTVSFPGEYTRNGISFHSFKIFWYGLNYFNLFFLTIFIFHLNYWILVGTKMCCGTRITLGCKPVTSKTTKTSKYCINKSKRRLKNSILSLKCKVSFDDKLVVYCWLLLKNILRELDHERVERPVLFSDLKPNSGFRFIFTKVSRY